MRLLPFTTNVAPEADSVAVPSVELPAENVTLPVGTALPLAGFTVTDSWVDAVDAMFAGLAVTDVVVLTADAVTVTAIDAEEAAKLPAGE
ncbi:MAG TPA: hypothetical protein VMR62_01640 [Bryobacteraceae bacterium]|nr:hypothetical protein [Bryobacteraceae bacterium]